MNGPLLLMMARFRILALTSITEEIEMAEPLTKSQRSLRGKKVVDMTDDQLRDWIDACAKMEWSRR